MDNRGRLPEGLERALRVLRSMVLADYPVGERRNLLVERIDSVLDRGDANALDQLLEWLEEQEAQAESTRLTPA